MTVPPLPPRGLRRTGGTLAALALTIALGGCGSGDDPTAAGASSTAPTTSTAVTETTGPTTATSIVMEPLAPETTAPATPSTTWGSSSSAQPLAGRVVVIDPGHNGANHAHSAEMNRPVDAGGFQKACNTTGTAGADGYSEAQFNWETAVALREALVTRGAEVVLTRANNDGWGPCIDERGLTATEAGADLLVSIHADGAAAGERGFHVIHPGPVAGYTDAVVAPSADAAVAVRDALVAAGLEVSTYAGGGGLIERTDLGTLNRAGTPAVMLEAGNMRDATDLARLRSPEGQAALVTALADGITAYLSPAG